MVEKENEIISENDDVTKDHDGVKIPYFVGVDKLFEEQNQIVGFDKNNCGVDDLIENCDSIKVDVSSV